MIFDLNIFFLTTAVLSILSVILRILGKVNFSYMLLVLLLFCIYVFTKSMTVYCIYDEGFYKTRYLYHTNLCIDLNDYQDTIEYNSNKIVVVNETKKQLIIKSVIYGGSIYHDAINKWSLRIPPTSYTYSDYDIDYFFKEPPKSIKSRSNGTIIQYLIEFDDEGR